MRHRVLWAFAFLFGIMLAAASLAVSVMSGVLGVERDRRLVFPTALIGGALLVLVVTAGVRMYRRTVRPVADVLDAADRVAAGDYSARVPERGPGEIRRLAKGFNQMAERLGTNEARRRDLLADLAHELRTPLSVIRGNAEGMLDGVYATDREYLEPIVDEANVMARLLEDLQTLSTAEAGALKLHREPAAPGDLVEDAVSAFRSQAEAAGVRLETDVAEGLPSVDADPVRAGQVLSNLLSNAIRHTPKDGTVTVSAAAGDDGVMFQVTDTGKGIPTEDLPRVFERFTKGSESRGAGLGLAIAKALVEAHGGTITAESDAATGTTIRFTLPIEAKS